MFVVKKKSSYCRRDVLSPAAPVPSRQWHRLPKMWRSLSRKPWTDTLHIKEFCPCCPSQLFPVKWYVQPKVLSDQWLQRHKTMDCKSCITGVTTGKFSWSRNSILLFIQENKTPENVLAAYKEWPSPFRMSVAYIILNRKTFLSLQHVKASYIKIDSAFAMISEIVNFISWRRVVSVEVWT